MDVGCTQINLMYHPNAFASLDDAFDPERNAAYAARFLTDLFHQAGSWPHAAAAYHSQTPELGTDYQRKVLEAWAEPTSNRGTPQSSHPARTAGEFHRQLASLYSSPETPPSRIPFSGRPFGHGLGAPLGGFGRIMRTSGGIPSWPSGRTLAAYRAMPVAMLTTPPRPSRY